MAESLEEVFQRVNNANSRVAQGNIGAPQVAPASAEIANPVPRWQRVLSATLPEVGASIVSAPTSLYALLGAGVKYATGAELPGAQGAAEISDSINKPVRELSNRLAGETIDDNLLSGDPLQVAAAWGRLGLGAGISAPRAAAVAVTEGAAKLKTGIEVVDQIGKGGLRVLEALTPITITTSPSKAVAATNIAVAGALGSVLEATLGPTTTVKEAKQQVDEKAKGALDVAAEGATQVQRSDPRTIQAGLSGDPTYDAVGIGLLGAAALAYWKRGAMADAWTGVRNSLEKSVTGYDPAEPVNKTLLGMGSKITQQNVNRNEGMVETLRRSLVADGMPKNIADARAEQFAEYAAARTGASVNTRMQSIYNDGVLPDSKIKITPVSDWYARYRGLDDAAKDLLDRAWHSQRELDTRRIDNIWHNFPTTPNRELESYVRQVRANPELNYIYEDFLKTTRQLAEYTREQKRFSNREVNLFMSKNPNFVPENLTDPNGRWLNQRSIGMDRGWRTFEEAGSPAKLLPRYIDEVVRSTEGKKIQRGFMTNMQRLADRGNPYATKIMGHTITERPPNATEGMYVHWRNAHGESRWTRIEDALVRDSLRDATNPSALQLANGALSAMTRLYESGSVGSLAAATGSTFFAPKSALYTATIAPMMREKGVAMGWLDRYVQDLTKNRFGVKGDVLTMAPDAAFRAAQNVSAVMAQRMSRTLRNSVVTDGMFTKMLGPKGAQLAAQSLDNYFKRSAVYDLQQRGILGPASLMSIDPSKSFKDAEQMLRGHGLLQGGASFLTDILHAISSAPAMSVLAMNKGRKGVSDSQLSSAIRNMAGDPARSGAFRRADGRAGTNWAGQLTNATPWGNIFLQATSRFAKAWRKDPAGTAMGVFNGVAMPAIGVTLWNAAQGPEYSDYQFNQRTPDRTAGGLYIAIPGLPPEMGVEIDYDPMLRPFKWASELLAAAPLGLLDGSFFAPDNAEMQKAFKDMIEHRAFSLDEGSVTGAAAKQVLMPPPVPAAKAVAAIGGVDLRDYTDWRGPQDRKEGGFTPGEGKNPQATFMSQYWPAQTELILRSIGSGAFANIWGAMTDAETRVKEANATGGSVPAALGESVKNFGKQTKLRAADSTKMIGSGPLFDTFLAISPSTEAASSLVKQKLEGLRNLQQALQQATIPGGVPSPLLGNKKQGFQEPLGASLAASPPDLQMMQLAEMAGKIYKQLADAELGSNKIHYDQMQSIRNSTQFTPEMKRALTNEQALAIIENNRKLLQDIQRHEAVISSMFGRKITFDGINLGKSIQGQR